MDDALKKKMIAAATAVVGALVFGESQVLDMEERLQALEDIHPELAQEAVDEIAEELETDESIEEAPVEEDISDEEQIEEEESAAESQPLISEEEK
tara:strand:+ start:1060 stop:1347 length:288 start_codon:yes stop_codon:yes gene_type:complete